MLYTEELDYKVKGYVELEEFGFEKEEETKIEYAEKVVSEESEEF